VDAHSRRRFIADQVDLVGEVAFADLAGELGVSEMTIRRDIEVLEGEGVLRRIVGGAIALRGPAAEPPFHTRASRAAPEKEHIARAVVDLLVPGETVLLDSGSTVLSVAREVRERGVALTVVTPSVLAAVHLADAPGVSVHLLGGLIRAGELSVIGPDAIEALSRFNCDTFVMGVAGVDEAGGISDYHYDEAHVKREGARVASRVIVAADQSKLGSAALVKITELSEIDALVTDAPDRHPVVTRARELGIQVITSAREAQPLSAGGRA